MEGVSFGVNEYAVAGIDRPFARGGVYRRREQVLGRDLSAPGIAGGLDRPLHEVGRSRAEVAGDVDLLRASRPRRSVREGDSSKKPRDVVPRPGGHSRIMYSSRIVARWLEPMSWAHRNYRGC